MLFVYIVCYIFLSSMIYKYINVYILPKGVCVCM